MKWMNCKLSANHEQIAKRSENDSWMQANLLQLALGLGKCSRKCENQIWLFANWIRLLLNKPIIDLWLSQPLMMPSLRVAFPWAKLIAFLWVNQFHFHQHFPTTVHKFKAPIAPFKILDWKRCEMNTFP